MGAALSRCHRFNLVAVCEFLELFPVTELRQIRSKRIDPDNCFYININSSKSYLAPL